ncbi:succinylglutamate desuccinylase [Tatumella terrea]|uniref:succinylglutamate desuccinylase n=1 Tax=Tatumella terrea TaxID=419007 RepID=UPI0031DECCBD
MTDYLQGMLTGQPALPPQGENAVLFWREKGEGILELIPRTPRQPGSLIISAGIHGNETAPIEILNQLVTEILRGECVVAQRLLVIFGNPAAIRQGVRFVDYDMNRLFSGYRDKLPPCDESQRAAQLEQAVSEFRGQDPAQSVCWHLDLHTAIRGSLYPKFGLLPASPRPRNASFTDWLGRAGLEALVFHQAPGGTFSHFTCHTLAAESCTLELGKALPFGCNALADFNCARQALRARIGGDTETPATPDTPPRHFRVVRQLTRTGADFHLHMSDTTPNFTWFPPGTILSEEGGRSERVLHPEGERVLFPNPRVAYGQRAGLMLEEEL